jgi:uncharacterized protein (DUF1501 family)
MRGGTAFGALGPFGARPLRGPRAPRRRDLLRWAAAALAGAAVARAGRAWAQPKSSRIRRSGSGPRYFLSIFLSGGIDPILSTDPKVRADVEPWVDVPYGPAEIVAAGGMALGPCFAPLAPVAGRMAIVNGVALRTANHNTGTEQFLRMRTGTRPEMPSLLQILGAHRDGQAVGCMDWLFGASQLSRLFGDAAPDDLRRLGAVLRGQSRRVLGDGGSAAARVTAASLLESADLCERVADLPPLRPERWSPVAATQALAASLQRVLWLFEHDLTRCFELDVGGIDQPWDTHTFNAERQRSASAPVPMIARFLGELGRRRGRRGPLADETLVVMGSEIGRFPALNGARGKDHFPEAPFVLFGAGIDAGAVFGRTGRDMAALPVSPRSGRQGGSGGHRIQLDDLGASLLRLGGIPDPTVYGYTGTILDFLVGG